MFAGNEGEHIVHDGVEVEVINIQDDLVCYKSD
jgi:hypothetical protein